MSELQSPQAAIASPHATTSDSIESGWQGSVPDAFFLVATAALVGALVPGPSWLAWIPATVAIVGGILMLAFGKGERGTLINAVVIAVCAWGIAILVSLGQVAAVSAEPAAIDKSVIAVGLDVRVDGELGGSAQ